MSLDLLEGLKVVSEVASCSVFAVAILVEFFAFLRLELASFSLGVQGLEESKPLAAHFLLAMSELALVTIAAVAKLSEMFAQGLLVDIQIIEIFTFFSVKLLCGSEILSSGGIKALNLITLSSVAGPFTCSLSLAILSLSHLPSI